MDFFWEFKKKEKIKFVKYIFDVIYFICDVLVIGCLIIIVNIYI